MHLMIKLDLQPNGDQKPAIFCVVQFLDEQRVSLNARTSSGDILTENSDYYIITIGSVAALMIYRIALARGNSYFFLFFESLLSIGCVRCWLSMLISTAPDECFGLDVIIILYFTCISKTARAFFNEFSWKLV